MDTHLETWNIHSRIVLYLMAAIPSEALSDAMPAKSRSVGNHLRTTGCGSGARAEVPMKTEMTEIVAEMTLTGQDQCGNLFPVIVQIGHPYRKNISATRTKGYCPVTIQGLHTPLPDMPGVDTFSALQAALQIAVSLLKDFVVRGGKLYWSEKVYSSVEEINEEDRLTLETLAEIFPMYPEKIKKHIVGQEEAWQ